MIIMEKSLFVSNPNHPAYVSRYNDTANLYSISFQPQIITVGLELHENLNKSMKYDKILCLGKSNNELIRNIKQIYNKYQELIIDENNLSRFLDIKENMIITTNKISFKNKHLKRLIMNSKSIKVILIVSTDTIDIPPDLRCQFNYVYLKTKDYSNLSLKKIYNYFGTDTISLQDYSKLIDNNRYIVFNFEINKCYPHVVESVLDFIVDEY